MEKKIYYIYKITILTGNLNGYYYIGKRVHRCDRVDNYHGSGVIIRRWFKKEERIEGVDYIKEILCYCNNKEELNIRESEYIKDLYDTDNKCLNLMEGGFGGKLSKKSIDKMRKTILANPEHSERCRNNGKRGAKKQSELKKGNTKYIEIARNNAIKGGPKAAKTRALLYKEHPEIIERIIFKGKNKPIEELNRINYEKGRSGRNTKWMNNLKKNKRVPVDEIEYYKSIGYIEGKLNYANNK